MHAILTGTLISKPQEKTAPKNGQQVAAARIEDAKGLQVAVIGIGAAREALLCMDAGDEVKAGGNLQLRDSGKGTTMLVLTAIRASPI